ncbi:hypothetical protein ACFLU5_14950 [Bacteroidota bacterium]
MRKTIYLIPALWCIISCTHKNPERIININDIKIHNDLFYYGDEKTPYTGWCEQFYQNGKISNKSSIKDGKYDGPMISFYENEQKSYEANYKQGILDGSCTSWYLNGQKRTMFTYKDGKVSGTYIKWDYKGNKVFDKDYSFSEQKENGKINISSEQDVLSARERLIKHIWGIKNLPADRLVDSVETDIVFITEEGKTPYQTLYNAAGNLKQIDLYRVFMPYSFVSNVYHFRPVKSINKVFFYHAGHTPGGFQPEDSKTNNAGVEPGLVVPWLLKEGYDVITFTMPLSFSDWPTMEIDHGVGKTRFPSGTKGHNLMFDYFERPYTFFIEDMLASVNYIEKHYQFEDIYLMGLSGGGWATTLYAAIDPRIRYSFPVAGSIPTYLRVGTDIGDAEQGYLIEYDPEGLYSIANFEELYVLGSYGENRRQIQILNEYDDCCFSGTRHTYWIEDVKAAVKKLGQGEYDFYLEQDTRTHKVSKMTMNVILSSIKDCKLELMNDPPEIVVVGKEYYFNSKVKSTNGCVPVKNLDYSLIVSPSWLSIDSLSGILTGKPSRKNVGDTLYSYKAVDGFGGFILKDVKIKVTNE